MLPPCADASTAPASAPTALPVLPPCLPAPLPPCLPVQVLDPSTNDEYSRVITPETAMTDEVEDVCAMLVECLELRKHWLFRPAREWRGGRRGGAG